MSLPNSWTQVEVTGKMLTLDGSPRVGVIAFQTMQPTMIDGDIVPNAMILARLNDAGEFSVTLPSTDDPDIQPTGWTYRVTEFLPRPGTPREVFVPGDVATINYGDLLQLPSVVNAPQTLTVVSSSQITVDPSQHTVVAVTALHEPLHINNPAGTMREAQRVLYRIKDNGTPRALTFGNKFSAHTATLPVTTTPGKNLYIATVYDAVADKWDVLAAV